MAVDVTRYWLNDPAISYGFVFVCEGVLLSSPHHWHATFTSPTGEVACEIEAPSFGDIALAEAGEEAYDDLTQC